VAVVMLAPSSSGRIDLRLLSVLLVGLAGRTRADGDERIIGGTVVAGSERSCFSLVILSAEHLASVPDTHCEGQSADPVRPLV